MSVFTNIARRYIPQTVPVKVDGLRVAFDLEADGLLDTATKLHCIVIADLDSDRTDEYGPEQIPAALAHLSRAGYITGHNVVAYDFPLLQRLHDWAPSPSTVVVDTLVAGRLAFPNVDDLDSEATDMGDSPMGKLRGRHSLEAWGVRLGIPKTGTDITDWSAWTPEMQERCVGDVKITKALWRFLQPDGYSSSAMALEHRVAPICELLTKTGVPFDKAAAEELHERWTAHQAELEARLQEQFPGLNPNSRAQIGKLLEEQFGHVFEKRTEKTGQPKIDDELLETISAQYPALAGLSDYHILGRRLASLKSWCKAVDEKGLIHGGLIPIGTPHGRAAHMQPNLAAVPNPNKGKPYAAECRALFQAGNGWVFVKCDQKTLQDRGYAHYLIEFDDGAYAGALLSGADQHWRSTITLGLVPEGAERDKQNKALEAAREGAKRFHYARLYGCGLEMAGRIVHDTARAVMQIDPSSDLLQRFFGGTQHPSQDALKRVGKQALNKFETGMKGLRSLREKLQGDVAQRGWVHGLDGRRVPVRAQYSALNYQVTSSEAIITKRWLVNVYDELVARYSYGLDGDVALTLWVHDELVCCCRPEIAQEVGELMVRLAREPAEYYGFEVPLDADFTIGRSWAGEPIGAIDPIDASTTTTHAAPDIEELDEPQADELDDGVADLFRDDAGAGAVESAPPAEPEPAASPASGGVLGYPEGQNNRPTVNCEPRARQGNGQNGRAQSNGHSGNYSDHTSEKQAGKPYGLTRAALVARGYQVVQTFPFTVPGEAEPRFFEDRWELKPEITPTKERPRKTSRYRHWADGQELNDTGPRRIIYNWPAIMAAGPGANVFVVEGANKAKPLNEAGHLATAAPYHQWGPECTAALAGHHLFYLEDHDLPDEHGRIKAKELSTAARKKLATVGASFRIVPALHLWKNLGRNDDPPHGWDVKDWLEQGGDPTRLLDLCRVAPTTGNIVILSKAEFLSGFVPPDYLVDGILQRRFIYSLTGQTGHAKTAIALRIAQLVDCEGALAGHDVARGRVAYLVGENPDDVRMRVIGDDATLGSSGPGNIIFIPGVFDTDALLQQIEALGTLDLVIIDTSAAYFLGDDENSNPQLGEHARKLRRLITLPGRPCGLVLCHPIKHAAEPEQLLPRGGGAFLAEVDGNLTAWKEDHLITLHHSDKFRGPGFEPITFRLDSVCTEQLKDSKGRLIPTVRAVAISESEEAKEAEATRSEENEVLIARFQGGKSMSVAEIAVALGWVSATGQPYKSKVHRALMRLKVFGLMKRYRGKWDLTEKGEKAAKEAQT